MRRAVNGVGDADSISDWFASIPIITKILVTSTVLCAGLTSLNILNPMNLIFNWDLIQHKFQIWRIFTPCVFAGGFSFNFLMHTVVLYENCRRYEANPFNTGAGGNAADFLWLILIALPPMLFLCHYFELPVASVPLLYVIMYVWSRREPDAVVKFYGFKIQGLYLPWIYIAINTLMGNSITSPLIGVGVGHLYFFVTEILPISYGTNLIKTPAFCVDLISLMTRSTVTAVPNNQQQQQPQGFGNMGAGHQWGRGRTLGGQQ